MPIAPAADVLSCLREHGWTVGTCESLTAGLLCATLADVPGASAALRGGLVTYATDLKAALAGVDQAVLDAQGPVSEDTARAMAQGARSVLNVDWAVALTGVAGPQPQDGHPVGEVWAAVAGPWGTAARRLGSAAPGQQAAESGDLLLRGSRAAIRKQAVAGGLDLLREQLGMSR